METSPKSGHVAIIGAGLIGRSWAVAYARGGFAVRMFDPVAGAAGRSHALIPQMLADLAELDLLRGQGARDIAGLVSVAASLAEAVKGACHVQENGPEDVTVKAAIFSEIDAQVSDDAVIASSTSMILPSQFTGHIKHKAQCVVAHPLNPPHLIPAVELVPAAWTRKDILEQARRVLLEIGQRPIVMMKEIDGFLMNRLQGALLEECFRLLEGGYVSVEDIDAGIRDGLALRWSFMGPFETIDLNAPKGIRDYVERYDNGFVRMRQGSQWRADWRGKTLDRAEGERAKQLPRDRIQERQDWRDRQLMLLAAYRKGLGNPQ